VNQTPKFSVLLPTRNRSHVVHHAIKSVLDQTRPDLELIISDNSSNDDTLKVVQGINDERIKYHRTDRVLAMPDNFDNALAHSRGEWITLLPDDCVLSTRALEIVEAVTAACPTKLVVWDWWHFYPSNTTDPARRLQYIRRPFDNKVRYQRSRDTLRDLFRLTHGKNLPKPYQSCVHRSLIEALRRRVGRAFPPPAPDYTFLTGILAVTDEYAFLDLPMMLSNAADTTPHASPEAFKRFLDELNDAKKGGWMPIKIPIIHPGTILVESICRMQAELPELSEFPLDLENFLVDFKHQLAMYDRQKYPVELERVKFEEFLAQQPIRTRIRVNVAYARLFTRQQAKTQAKRIILKTPLLERLAGLASHNVVVRGEREGFQDINQAMRHLERSFGPVTRAEA
jgi:hypothetical protein